jgi:hypothetical protein
MKARHLICLLVSAGIGVFMCQKKTSLEFSSDKTQQYPQISKIMAAQITRTLIVSPQFRLYESISGKTIGIWPPYRANFTNAYFVEYRTKYGFSHVLVGTCCGHFNAARYTAKYPWSQIVVELSPILSQDEWRIWGDRAAKVYVDEPIKKNISWDRLNDLSQYSSSIWISDCNNIKNEAQATFLRSTTGSTISFSAYGTDQLSAWSNYKSWYGNSSKTNWIHLTNNVNNFGSLINKAVSLGQNVLWLYCDDEKETYPSDKIASFCDVAWKKKWLSKKIYTTYNLIQIFDGTNWIKQSEGENCEIYQKPEDKVFNTKDELIDFIIS